VPGGTAKIGTTRALQVPCGPLILAVIQPLSSICPSIVAVRVCPPISLAIMEKVRFSWLILLSPLPWSSCRPTLSCPPGLHWAPRQYASPERDRRPPPLSGGHRSGLPALARSSHWSTRRKLVNRLKRSCRRSRVFCLSMFVDTTRTGDWDYIGIDVDQLSLRQVSRGALIWINP
jgi:hypothetical protein